MSKRPADVLCQRRDCGQPATHIVNWTTERRRQWLCTTHAERQQDWFPTEIQVTERGISVEGER